jgi:5'-nucleotidase
MAYPIHRKLVIGVASSALFDLNESDDVFEKKGLEAYRVYQQAHKEDLLPKGVAFPFVRRFLSINKVFPDKFPVEVVLLSKNDPATGQRVFNSIKQYGLDISRAGFLSGKTPYRYMPVFNISLFLSANENDVIAAVQAGFPAGTVLSSHITDDENDKELRVAFDFDGVIADDEAEAVYQRSENVSEFQQHEFIKKDMPHTPGPLSDLFRKLSLIQKLELKKEKADASYKRILRIAIVSARSAPAHERVITTLSNWGVMPDETFFLGGVDKRRVLEIMKPHIFFDDQMRHLSSVAGDIPSVHIPFGVRNSLAKALPETGS